MMIIIMKANDHREAKKEGGGGGECHVKTPKFRRQSPYLYILIDQFCLDFKTVRVA